MPHNGRPTVPEVIEVVRDYYEKPGNGAGGTFHVVLDDGNIEDKFVKWCIEQAQSLGDSDGVAMGALLLLMTKTQRAKIYRLRKWR